MAKQSKSPPFYPDEKDRKKRSSRFFFALSSATFSLALLLLFHNGCQSSPATDQEKSSNEQQSEKAVEAISPEETPSPPEESSPPSEEIATEAALPDAAAEATPEERINEETPDTVGACNGIRPEKDAETWTLKHDDATRFFRVKLPSRYDGKTPLAVVLNFHGLSNDSWQQDLLSGMESHAEKEGFIAIHADGWTLPVRSWNAGVCCSPAAQLGVDDIGFVNAMLDELEAKLCIDKRRIFATGISNGGMLAYRLACELSERIAAIAPVAATLVTSPCKPPRPVPVLAFHGLLDSVVPYAGNPFLLYPSIPSTVTHWQEHNACGEKKQRSFDQGDAYCDRYEGCKEDASVELCLIRGGGHTWPGGLPIPALGYTSLSLDATAYMWAFFQKHPLPLTPAP